MAIAHIVCGQVRLKAVQSWKNLDDIVIKLADNGSTIGVMDKTNYTTKVMIKYFIKSYPATLLNLLVKKSLQNGTKCASMEALLKNRYSWTTHTFC